MRSLDPLAADPPLELAGILDAWPRSGGGAHLSRLSPAARAQSIDPVLDWTATMPSGARLDLVTDSTTIEVDVLLTRLAYGDDPPAPAAFDLVVDGELVAGTQLDGGNVLRFSDRRSFEFDIERGDPVSVRFDGLHGGSKRVELWLAHNASVELLDVRVDDAASAAPPDTNAVRRWAHYGSSISHCTEARRPTEVWPVAAARRAGVDLVSLAVAGQCHVDQFVARTIRDLDVDLVSLKLGINVVNGDSLRERAFVPAVHGFLDTVRDGHPDVPVVVATPIVCPAVEDRPGPTIPGADGSFRGAERTAEDRLGSLTLGRVRELLGLVVAARREAGDTNLHLVDGLALFGPDDAGDLYDGLHPTPEGYLRIADRFHKLAFGPGGPFAS